MKMVMVVVAKEEANDVLAALVASGHTATFVESKGGVLRQSSQALFIVVEDKDLDAVLDTINCSCQSSVSLDTPGGAGESAPSPIRQMASVGGAVVFVWELERFERYGAYGGSGAPEGAA